MSTEQADVLMDDSPPAPAPTMTTSTSADTVADSVGESSAMAVDSSAAADSDSVPQNQTVDIPEISFTGVEDSNWSESSSVQLTELPGVGQTTIPKPAVELRSPSPAARPSTPPIPAANPVAAVVAIPSPAKLPPALQQQQQQPKAPETVNITFTDLSARPEPPKSSTPTNTPTPQNVSNMIPAKECQSPPPAESMIIGALNWQIALKSMACFDRKSASSSGQTPQPDFQYQSLQAKNNQQMSRALATRITGMTESIVKTTRTSPCSRFVSTLLNGMYQKMAWKRNVVKEFRISDLTGRLVVPKMAIACLLLPMLMPNTDPLDKAASAWQLFVFEDDPRGHYRAVIKNLHLLNVFREAMASEVKRSITTLYETLKSNPSLTPDMLVSQYNAKYFDSMSRNLIASYRELEKLESRMLSRNKVQ
jgi:hypothetical protein